MRVKNPTPPKSEVVLQEIRGLLSSLQEEVAQLEAQYRRVADASERDDLTGLLRRNAFFRKWDDVLHACARAGEECGVLVVDVDHFKKINDTHGHPTGDEVLKRVGQLLKNFESERCFAARLGGEEFALVMRGDSAETLALGEFVRRGVERLYGPARDARGEIIPSVTWRCTVSVGAATSRREGLERAKLMGAADQALYAAKAKGRNQVRAA